ncbi:L,D-transpeptidase family protein [Nocardia sp. NPDC051030]|uniref:L,D-transpeptidase family protein n=1 Tax=Nocardia sp. NPDC051030 TaxID=3155162 RepID=UPI00341C3052
MWIGACGTDHAPQQLPLSYDGPADQVITVVADHPDATTATVLAWDRVPGGWRPALGPAPARVGADGIGPASEIDSRTPVGTWSLTEAFGYQSRDDLRLPYRHIGTSDWWVSDVSSPLYNTYYHCDSGTCPFDEDASENLGRAGFVYDQAVVIDYNRSPAIPGAGSAFFLHNTNDRPTAGCVAIPAANLRAIMRWLDPARHPVIAIGA